MLRRQRLAALAARRQREAESIILDDPYVKHLMHDFGATIVPGSIKPAQHGNGNHAQAQAARGALEALVEWVGRQL